MSEMPITIDERNIPNAIFFFSISSSLKLILGVSKSNRIKITVDIPIPIKE
jgi:hypothetical protein